MEITRSEMRRRNLQVSKTLELPMDIIFDILSRLPVKSLMRFKCVSKTWNNFIKSPSFIKQHLINSKLNPSPVFDAVLSTVYLRETDKQVFRINLIDTLDKPIDIDFPFMSDQKYASIVNISNGLVCVMLPIGATELSRIAICNPLTSEFRLVPGIDDDCANFDLTVKNSYSTFFGFCLNDDKGYEFFRMFYEPCPGDEQILNGEAYSLSTNIWRKINVKQGNVNQLKDHSKPRAYDLQPLFVRGVFYWSAFSSTGSYVVSLDVEKEVFEVLLAPEDCNNEVWTLRNFNGDIVVVLYHGLSFDVWVLNEREKIWEMKVEIDEIHDFRSDSVLYVLGCVRSGEIVVEDYDEKTMELYLFDVNANDLELLPYVNPDEKCEVFLYSESLVSINADDDIPNQHIHQLMQQT